jgi:hypothetical protein
MRTSGSTSFALNGRADNALDVFYDPWVSMG